MCLNQDLWHFHYPFWCLQFWNHLSIWDFLKTPSVIYFRSPLSKCDSVRRLPSTLTSLEKSSNLYLWKLQLLYIFEILWAIVTQVKGFQSLSRRSTLPVLKGSFILISLKTPSVIYFQNPLSNCDSVRSLPSNLRRITSPSLEKSFYLISLRNLSAIFKSSQHLWHGERAHKFFREVSLIKLCEWV